MEMHKRKLDNDQKTLLDMLQLKGFSPQICYHGLTFHLFHRHWWKSHNPSLKRLEALDKLDANAGTISEVPSITRLRDRS